MNKAAVGFCRNPLIGMRASDMRVAEFGTTIRSHADETGGPLICRFNGEWLLREHWEETLGPGDVVEFYDLPQGREDVRLILQVALIFASVVPGLQVAAPYLAALNAAYNLLVPPRQPQQNEQPGTVYSTSLAGNAARLDQAIWKNCGRVKITPPFAAQPYYEFLPSDPLNPTVDTDQYYYVVFAVGLGNHDIEKVLIGKTAISHFQDVLVAQYLAPGVLPSTALCNVVTSDEVSGLELKPDDIYAGPFAACRPGDRVTKIGIDVTASQGLGINDNVGDGSHSVTVEWQVEAREINNFGTPIGEWQVIANETRTAETNTAQRWSNLYTLAAPIRPEVRVVRTNVKDPRPGTRDQMEWFAMRAYLEREATLNPDTAHYEVVIRASAQLSSLSQRDFSMIVRGKCRTWDPVGGWGPEVFTRNPAWWLADLWTSGVWGDSYPDSRVDLQGLYAWSLTLDDRQDHFDNCFASGRDSWDAAQTIARVGRARASRPFGVNTIARDELVDLPTTAFSVRNTQPGSIVMQTSLPDRAQPNGVVVEFQNYVRWDQDTVECPCPGYSISIEERDRRIEEGRNVDTYDAGLPVMDRPIYLPIEGVTGPIQAEREGLYMAAKIALRSTTINWTTEMEGVLVRFLDTVRVQPELTGYGQSGDVAFWNGNTRQMGLTEPPDFTGGPLYLTLIRMDGSATEPVLIAPGGGLNDIVLPSDPDFDFDLDNAYRERPKYLLGHLDTGDELVKVNAIGDGGKTDGGAQLYDVQAYVDDPRVHAVDNALLPGPGVIQDPIDDGLDYSESGGGGVATLVRLVDHVIEDGNTGLPDDTYRGGLVEFTMGNNGSATFYTESNAQATITTAGEFDGEWLNTEPVELAVASLYEIFAEDFGGGFANATANGATVLGTFGVWLPMSSSYTWSLFADDAVSDAVFGTSPISGFIRIRIRRIGVPTILATRRISLSVILSSSPP